jgi:hypothetical protein
MSVKVQRKSIFHPEPAEGPPKWSAYIVVFSMNFKMLTAPVGATKGPSLAPRSPARWFIFLTLALSLSLLICLKVAAAKPPARAPSPLTLNAPDSTWREVSAEAPTAQQFVMTQLDRQLKLIWLPAPPGEGAAIIQAWDAQFCAQDPRVQVIQHEQGRALGPWRGVWGGVTFAGRAGFYFGFELPQGGVYFLLAEGPATDAEALSALLEAAVGQLSLP